MTGKPTRQQVVEAWKSNGRRLLSGFGTLMTLEASAEAVADILVRAGLVEEPREPGWYWVRPNGATDWVPVWFNGEWWIWDYPFTGDEPHDVGKRITPPTE